MLPSASVTHVAFRGGVRTLGLTASFLAMTSGSDDQRFHEHGQRSCHEFATTIRHDAIAEVASTGVVGDANSSHRQQSNWWFTRRGIVGGASDLGRE